MLPEHVAKLLSDIDAIEADMRRLESRLTGVRERIHAHLLGGEFSSYETDGRKRQPKRPESAEGVHDARIPEF